MSKPGDLIGVPEDVRDLLKEIRKHLRSAVPNTDKYMVKRAAAALEGMFKRQGEAAVSLTKSSYLTHTYTSRLEALLREAGIKLPDYPEPLSEHSQAVKAVREEHDLSENQELRKSAVKLKPRGKLKVLKFGSRK